LVRQPLLGLAAVHLLFAGLGTRLVDLDVVVVVQKVVNDLLEVEVQQVIVLVGRVLFLR
jgi:hypothetical protein